MGNYNMQYQSYYNNLAKKQRGSNNFASRSKKQSGRSGFYLRRLTRELTGVLFLFIFVLSCKVVVTPQTQYAYNYSKEIINKQYNYSELIDKVKMVKFKDIEAITANFIEKVKSTVSGGREINDKSVDFKQF